MTKWLLTGGAGYIGSHVARELLAADIDVCVIDDLSTGVKNRIPKNVEFFQGSLLDEKFLKEVFSQIRVDGVIHLAAKKSVGESMLKPEYYFEENIHGLIKLMNQMHDHNIKNIVYSSSAAIYGEPKDPLVSEDSPTNPTSIYGDTKLIGEWLIENSQLNSIILRYFNVAGAGNDSLGDTAADNVIPKVFKALSEKHTPQIFGNDYPTPDGTCIRDYVHVSDLAASHAFAAKKLEKEPYSNIFNVGTGNGYSVKQLFEQLQKSTNLNFEYEIAPRRAGDPAATVADVKRIETELQFKAQHDLADMVNSAWQAWQFRLNSEQN
jgi:UDP-glucose 4-epimerase